MKGNKKLLVVALLLLLITVTFSTYAIYRESVTATGSINTAAWSVKLGSTNFSEVQNLTFGYSDITWTSNPGKNNKIAPGATGTITYTVDATGSEVDVIVEASIDSTNLPTGITATASGTNGQTLIAYDATSMTATITITVTWAGTVEDQTSKDTTDLNAKASTLSIPVTITARQKTAAEYN